MLFVTKEELEAPRSAAQLLSWVEERISGIGATAEGKTAIRFRRNLCKALVEEALPLGIFCTHYFNSSRCVIVKHVIGNQNYDAIVTDRRLKKSPIKYLEVTQAHEGENEHLRMISLEREGHVNILGRVKKHGTKHTGVTVEIENEGKDHEDVLVDELERIREAAERKSGVDYPNHTGLIIVFDDYISIRDSNDKDRLSRFLKDHVLSKLSNFCLIAVVGQSKRTYVEFDT